MHVLIVEDSAFNAFCLKRLLESVMGTGCVTLVNNSQAALSWIHNHSPDMVIVDGDLNAKDKLHCNGPVLAAMLLAKYPSLTVVAWTGSDEMSTAFTQVFHQYDKPVNEFTLWPKLVTLDRLSKIWSHYFNRQNETYAHHTRRCFL